MLLLALHVVALGLFLIFWTAEGSCEDIDENDENHHDPNADVYTEQKLLYHPYFREHNLLLPLGVAHWL